MNLLSFRFRFLPWWVALASTALGAPAADRPNLLVIQTDEHSFRTLGCYRALLPEAQAYVWGPGIAVETPHVDWLAQQGALADRYYATSPVCTPSRAAFMTGRYPQNTGSIQNDLPLRDEMVTFAEVLRRAGYATGYAGKWHLDGPGRPQFGPPRKFGWEDNRYMFNRGHWKKLEETPEGPRVAATDARGTPTYAVAGADAKSFTTDFLADRAIEFIRANQAKPFCYMVSFPDPHGPNTVRPPYDTMYLGLKFQQPQSARAAGERLPGYAAVVADQFNAVQMALYFGMVKCIDDNVGRILDALRAAGVLEKTVIVFTSDHGDMCGEHGRHNKGIPLEASARIPFIVRAPGRIAPGTVVRQALGTVDFKPTILALLGVANPSADEGRDASRLFTAGAPAVREWDDVAFIRIGGGSKRAAAGEEGEGPGWFGAFSRQHKLVVAPSADPSLFDLEQDPQELKNLINSPAHRETVRRLARALSAYAQQHGEPHLASSRVQADLAWAMTGTGDYALSEPSATKDGKRKKGKAAKKQ
jgi:arylsulfatase A-like enzyme